MKNGFKVIDFNRRMHNEGFSLVEMSIVLAIISVILAGVLPFLLESTKGKDADKTIARMNDIESAIQAFYARNSRLPCPADGTVAVNAAAYGKEAGVAGACAGSNYIDGGDGTVGGAVPTKDLHLPDEEGFDGWGRRFSYHVTTAATNVSTTGAIIVRDHTGGNRTTTAIYVLMSSGPNGHGAFTVGGTRFAGGITAGNAEKLQNCDCNAAAASGAYNNIFIQGMEYPSTNMDVLFDDVVRYMTEEQLQQKAYATAGPGTCPAGFTMIGAAGKKNSYCVDTATRAAADFYTAADTCNAVNNTRGRAHLCSTMEWYNACRTSGIVGFDSAQQWTDQVNADSTTAVLGDAGCGIFVAGGVAATIPYRCCQN